MTVHVDFTSPSYDPANYEFPLTIAYSAIGYEFGPGYEFCCDEHKACCPSCGTSLCLFCQDGCDGCGASIDFSR